jgi:biopolymer transport protein ExbD
MIGLKRKSSAEEAAIDMAPLIDMTFLLVIFFLVYTNFIKETGIEVKRPNATTGVNPGGDIILVGISSAGTLHMAGKRVDLASVRPNVAQMRLKLPEAPVVVVADEAVRASLLIRVIDECRLAGAKEINVATESPQ